jgi:hypothetical protein
MVAKRKLTIMADRINRRWCEKRHLCEKVPDLYADRDKSRASGGQEQNPNRVLN